MAIRRVDAVEPENLVSEVKKMLEAESYDPEGELLAECAVQALHMELAAGQIQPGEIAKTISLVSIALTLTERES